MADLMQKLSTNAPLLGLCIMYPSPGVIERIGPDWDWVWVDGQHGELDYNDMLAIVRACDLVKVPALVRIPWNEFSWIAKVLDMDAAGVIVPCVDTVEEAKAAVAAAKFPPLGRRSYGARRAIDFQGRMYSNTANKERLLFVQIESPAAVEAADAIAAVPGVDGLFLGPDDVMLRRGYTMDTPRNEKTLGADLKAVADACSKHGKLAIGVGIGAEMLKLNLQVGNRLIVAGGDVPFLANTSKTASAEARQIIAGLATQNAATKPQATSPY